MRRIHAHWNQAMRRLRQLGCGLGLVAVMASNGGGCAGLSSDATLQELLDSSGLGSTTIADVLGAIDQFSGNAAFLPFGRTLTTEQQDQLAALHDQFAAGEITGDEFHTKAAEILGVEDVGMGFGAGPGRCFGSDGFAGGPRGGHGGFGGPQERLDALLDLTDEQADQAQTIFDAMRTDVTSLQDAARDAIDAVLTDEQLAQLDELRSNAGGEHHGHRVFGPGIDRLAEKLELTEEQQTQIETLLDTLKTDVQTRREQARTEFRAILTDEQLAALDEFEAAHPRPDA
ncbi:LTXXQ motif protein [Phycisphaerae bacterium RAS1]|nr:LTXXQ motif protein [Phycisphaerae bacterium RAS1]